MGGERDSLLGNTNVHYRWVQYAGSIELMSFNSNECVYNFGTLCLLRVKDRIDRPLEARFGRAVLDGVEPGNPKTYNETFIIRPENNTFVRPQSVRSLAERPVPH